MRKVQYRNLPNNSKFKVTRDSDTWWYKRGDVAVSDYGSANYRGKASKRVVYVPIKKRQTWKARYLRLEEYMSWIVANCTPYSDDELRDKYDYAKGC